MKRKLIENLTTSERLTLLEQLFAPQGGDFRTEYASCALSDMLFLFDFEDANLLEITWSASDGGINQLIETVNGMISPAGEQELGLGMSYMIHAIMPREPLSMQSIISWMEKEPLAIEHFVSTTDASDNITLRIVFIENEIGDKIADEVFKNNRITNN